MDIYPVGKHHSNQDKQDKAAAQIFVQVEVAQQVAEVAQVAEAQAEAQVGIEIDNQ